MLRIGLTVTPSASQRACSCRAVGPAPGPWVPPRREETRAPPAAGGSAIGQGEQADVRRLHGCFGELSVGESVPLLAVAAVEGDPIAVDGHRMGAPYAVRSRIVSAEDLQYLYQGRSATRAVAPFAGGRTAGSPCGRGDQTMPRSVIIQVTAVPSPSGSALPPYHLAATPLRLLLAS